MARRTRPHQRHRAGAHQALGRAPLPDGRELALALDPQRGELLLAEGQGAQVRVLARHPAPGFEVERLCLHRDPQGLLHAFLLGKEGQSEQWLLDGAQARVMRPLATPLEPADCAVRDAEQRLYVTEPGVGLWALATDAERPAASCWPGCPRPTTRRCAKR